MEINYPRLSTKKGFFDGNRSTGKEIDEICPYVLSCS
jgi:hypothetical protein